MNVLAKTLGTFCSVLMIGTAGSAQEISIVLQSAEGNPNSPLFLAKVAWAESVSALTNGEVAVSMAVVDSIVPRLESLNAIRDGDLDGHITATAYFNTVDPAFGLMGDAVGAWSSPEEMLEFIEEGGGRALMDELLEPFDAHFVGSMSPGLEAFVSNVPLSGIDDLNGLRMRAPEGMVTSVFNELGVITQNMGLNDVKEGLESGTLDIADFSVFSNNTAVGLHDVAKHPIYPGFHSMPLIEFTLSNDIWDQISPESQAILTASFKDFALTLSSDVREADLIAVEDARNDPTITVHDWSSEERNRFRVVALEKWNGVTYESDMAIKVYEAVTSFLWQKGRLQ